MLVPVDDEEVVVVVLVDVENAAVVDVLVVLADATVVVAPAVVVVDAAVVVIGAVAVVVTSCISKSITATSSNCPESVLSFCSIAEA